MTAAAAALVPAVRKSSTRSWEASVLPAAVGFQCGCVGQQSYELCTCHQPHQEQGSGDKCGLNIDLQSPREHGVAQAAVVISLSRSHSKLCQSVSKNGSFPDSEEIQV